MLISKVVVVVIVVVIVEVAAVVNIVEVAVVVKIVVVPYRSKSPSIHMLLMKLPDIEHSRSHTHSQAVGSQGLMQQLVGKNTRSGHYTMELIHRLHTYIFIL